ncbi:hypothetical protein ACFQJD_07540 [Haloplanus sp. GCM10025708]|uniref:hypothetical protein n=1 Tax=Haloferacaceae TaxID=1644056 RepID=UPI003618A225
MSEDDSKHQSGAADYQGPEHEALATNSGEAVPDDQNVRSASGANGELSEVAR